MKLTKLQAVPPQFRRSPLPAGIISNEERSPPPLERTISLSRRGVDGLWPFPDEGCGGRSRVDAELGGDVLEVLANSRACTGLGVRIGNSVQS